MRVWGRGRGDIRGGYGKLSRRKEKFPFTEEKERKLGRAIKYESVYWGGKIWGCAQSRGKEGDRGEEAKILQLPEL